MEQPTATNWMRPETMLSTTVAGLLIAQFTDSLTDIPTLAALCHPFVIGLVLSFSIASAIIWQARADNTLGGMTAVYWLIGGITLFNAATGSFAAKQAFVPSPVVLASAGPVATSWLDVVAVARADETAQKPWFPPAEPTPQHGGELR